MHFSTLALTAAAVALSSTAVLAHNGSKAADGFVRNTKFPACDQPDGSLVTNSFHADAVAFTPDGLIPVEESDNPVFYVKPGVGTCGFNYTDADFGVCLNPGWVNSSYVGGCNKWVEVSLPSLGTKVAARVLDSCGGEDPKKFGFGCNDVYLTLAAYSALAAGNSTIIKGGRLPGPVDWKFIREPCHACWEGLPGKLPQGQPDTCQGPDSWGVLRSGRKIGDERKSGADAGEECEGNVSLHAGYKAELFKEAAETHGYKLNPTPKGAHTRRGSNRL